MEFTAEQKSILDAQFQQNIIVSACAGSGKTTVLIERAKRESEHLKKDIRSIGILTFTHNSKLDIQKRASELVDVSISTFHGFFIEHVLPFDTNLPYDKQLMKITFDWNEECRDIDKWKLYLYNNHAISRSSTSTEDFLLQHVLEIIQTNSRCRNYLQSKFVTLYIDEAQDNNAVQYEIIEELLNIGINVFLVGDHRQCIYKFRGADAEKFKAIKDDPRYKAFELSQNFRCHISINELANSLSLPIKNNIDEKNRGYRCADKSQMIEWKEKCNSNTRKKRIVILRRSNQGVEKIHNKDSDFKIIKKPEILDKENNKTALDCLLRAYFTGKNEYEFLNMYENPPQKLSKCVKKFLNGVTVKVLNELNTILYHTYGEYIFSSDKFEDLQKAIEDEGVRNYYTYSDTDNLVMTIHTAKGLEFEIVGIYKDDFNYMNNEDTKKLYYVACTRAEKLLLVFS